MNEYVIETKQVTKSYGSFLALDHVDIHVRRGEIYGLIGDNGAGKSTLLKLLAGHSYATKGEVRLFGKYEEKELENSRKKLEKKNLDMVIANNLKVDGAGFGTDTNVITMITKTDCTEFPKMSKFEVAGCIFDAIIKNMKARRTDEK